MNSFWRIFSLEFTAAVRSRTLALLLVASVAWMFAAPFMFTGDGTVEGARMLAVHYSLGGVATLLSISLLATATGSIARERAAKRLQMTMVRPVGYMTIALAKTAALVAIGAIVLAVATAIEAVRSDLSRPCRHVLSPVMPTPREEAETMYTAYMKDPKTPPAVKSAKKSVVIRLLAQRAFDRYETVSAGDEAQWRFRLPEEGGMIKPSVRLRFTNTYDIRQDVVGDLGLTVYGAEWNGCVSNITQAVVEVPLQRSDAALAAESGVLTFANSGESALMLRPRRDVNLLIEADGFGWNLMRAYIELVCMISLLVAFGVFLGVGLGRPVALFTAVVALAVSEMSPSVIDQYPDVLETNAADAIGLAITRTAAELTHPVSALEPLAKLSEDSCVEPREVLGAFISDIVIAPVLFALLSALVMPRKVEG